MLAPFWKKSWFLQSANLATLLTPSGHDPISRFVTYGQRERERDNPGTICCTCRERDRSHADTNYARKFFFSPLLSPTKVKKKEWSSESPNLILLYYCLSERDGMDGWVAHPWREIHLTPLLVQDSFSLSLSPLVQLQLRWAKKTFSLPLPPPRWENKQVKFRSQLLHLVNMDKKKIKGKTACGIFVKKNLVKECLYCSNVLKRNVICTQGIPARAWRCVLKWKTVSTSYLESYYSRTRFKRKTSGASKHLSKCFV